MGGQGERKKKQRPRTTLTRPRSNRKKKPHHTTSPPTNPSSINAGPPRSRGSHPHSAALSRPAPPALHRVLRRHRCRRHWRARLQLPRRWNQPGPFLPRLRRAPSNVVPLASEALGFVGALNRGPPPSVWLSRGPLFCVPCTPSSCLPRAITCALAAERRANVSRCRRSTSFFPRVPVCVSVWGMFVC